MNNIGISCDYFTVNELSQLSGDNLSFFNYNIRSFNTNGLVFQSFISSISQLPQIILLTETWNNSDNYKLCRLDNYFGHHTFRQFSRGGGVSVFCLDEFKSNKIDAACVNNTHIETCAVNVNIHGYIVSILGVYRPQTGSITICL